MAEKKHVFLFSTPSGDVEVQTDDLRDLSTYSWFRQFFETDDAVVSVKKAPVPGIKEEEDDTQYIDEEALDKEIETRAKEMAEKMVESRAYEMAKEMVRTYRQAEAAKQAQEQQGGQRLSAAPPQQAVQAQPVPVPIPPPQFASKPSMQNFMDIPPDGMTDEMWRGLTKDQQRAYAAKYVGK